MSRSMVDRIARAVLYEGYLLYPYRPSIKSRQRWTFGGIYPPSWSQVGEGADNAFAQTECLVAGGPDSVLEVKVRFLQLQTRVIEEWLTSETQPPGEIRFRRVDALQVGDTLWQSWQEAMEREILVSAKKLGALAAHARRETFSFAAHTEREELHVPGGIQVGALVRERQPIEGCVEVSVQASEDGLFRVRVRVENHTPLSSADQANRDRAMLSSLVSTHTILGVRGGGFVSLIDPPEPWRAAADGCRNIGCWPVLVGEDGATDTMLAAPIILYDYPRIAPESPGDLFDATEIDEILTLRILTLSDAEKHAMAAIDAKARALLQRTEALSNDQMLQMHGTMRSVRPLTREAAHE